MLASSRPLAVAVLGIALEAAHTTRGIHQEGNLAERLCAILA